MGCAEGGGGMAEIKMRLTILHFLRVPTPTSRDALLHQLVVAEAVDQTMDGRILRIWQPPMV